MALYFECRINKNALRLLFRRFLCPIQTPIGTDFSFALNIIKLNLIFFVFIRYIRATSIGLNVLDSITHEVIQAIEDLDGI